MWAVEKTKWSANGVEKIFSLVYIPDSPANFVKSVDLDPEGILIAQKLSRYYKGEFHYWHMETEDYEKCKSEEGISPKRMRILERITDDRLKPVVERIKAYETARYQEMLMEERK